jgi:hypothetical protein
MIDLICVCEDYVILGYEIVRWSVTMPLREFVFEHFPMLALSSIGKMLLARPHDYL